MEEAKEKEEVTDEEKRKLNQRLNQLRDVQVVVKKIVEKPMFGFTINDLKELEGAMRSLSEIKDLPGMDESKTQRFQEWANAFNEAVIILKKGSSHFTEENSVEGFGKTIRDAIVKLEEAHDEQDKTRVLWGVLIMAVSLSILVTA